MDINHWSNDFISILQAYGADLISRDEARRLMRVDKALKDKVGK